MVIVALMAIQAVSCGGGSLQDASDHAPDTTLDIREVPAVKDVPPDPGHHDDGDVTQPDYRPPPKGFLEPCEENAECEAGFCVGHMGEHVCSMVCYDPCPQGWKCRQVQGLGGDSVYVCLSTFWALCQPCGSNSDCKSPQGEQDQCVTYAAVGSFCGGTCERSEDCPKGYGCVLSTSVVGLQSWQCVLLDGDCPCPKEYVESGIETTCAVTNAEGTCPGKRHCTDDGLSDCDAPEAMVEVCDLKDNDCDGSTDEGFPGCCVCGNGTCEPQCESLETCVVDCTKQCGNLACEVTESPLNCPEDCCRTEKGVGCGDGACFGYACGESPASCPSDCGTACGNSVCDKGESPQSCSADCVWNICGNRVCEPGDGGAEKCPLDCAASCGDCSCEGTEDWLTCPVDCGFCGDGICSLCPERDEGIATCPKDCAQGVEVCNGKDDDGDGLTDEEGATGCLPFHLDEDEDGYGVVDLKCLCLALGKFTSSTGDDCDDKVAAVQPGMQEACNGKDDDCDGSTDEDLGSTTCGQGPCEHTVENCESGKERTCDPLAGAVGEVCNGVDDDCDGIVDESFLVDGKYIDAHHCGACGHDCDLQISFVKTTTCDPVPATPACVVVECQTGYVPSGLTACVPAESHLCELCLDDASCGVGGSLCLDWLDGRFCGQDCSEGAAFGTQCPDGFECSDAPGGARQCRPKSGSCDCTAGNTGESRSCQVSNEFGTCTGKRSCDPLFGWSACTAKTPVQETCNGEDDDCDGATDADFDDLDMDGIADCVDCDIDGDDLSNPNPGCPAPEPFDNCSVLANPGQEDLDGDMTGDVCDDDIDGDLDPNLIDCKPLDPAISHNATEVCDEIDNECDGQIDEADALGCSKFYLDADGDGWGTTQDKCLCKAEGKYTAVQSGDCDDNDKASNPGTRETCNNGKDDNCNGFVDEEDAEGCKNYYLDVDGDNYGVLPDKKKCLCLPGSGYTALNPGDCNDSDKTIYPTAPERCNGKDDDCDEAVDEDYPDLGNPCDGSDDDSCKNGTYTCNPSQDDVVCNNETIRNIKETCNGQDDDCDGITDEAFLEVPYYLGQACDGPDPDFCKQGMFTCKLDGTGTECINDTVGTSIELCNSKDDDCDGMVDEDFLSKGATCDGSDSDQCKNGTFTCKADGSDVECVNETNSNIVESCNGLDDDCDGYTDEDAAHPQGGTGTDLCVPGRWCVSGLCVCKPDCSGKECGDDGCGGTCGNCPGGVACEFWQCCTSNDHKACLNGNLHWYDKCGNSGTLAQTCQYGCTSDACHASFQFPTGYVLVPSGSFIMGSPVSEPGRYENETQHQVTISKAFYLKATEVTQGEWKALMGNNPSVFSSCGNNCPVENVSWWDSVAYCNALSAKEGLGPCYSLTGCSGTPGEGGYTCTGVTFVGLTCTGYRLPTESEWEYAARAGTMMGTYNGTSTLVNCEEPNVVLDPIAWFKANSCTTLPVETCAGGSGCGTHPVKGKPPNAWGLYDMLGNVWEWCWDWYGVYPPGPVSDPTGTTLVTGRVDRGGAWNDRAADVRGAARESYASPTSHGSDRGLRPARAALVCGGTACPVVTGYTATCNAQNHCEYANPDTTGWKQWDVWVHVPAGSFTMGSPAGEVGRSSSEDPNHEVTFRNGYLIGKYEVAVLQYEACMAASPATCTAPSVADWPGTNGLNTLANGRLTHPQNGLTWDQVGAVCTWLGGRRPSEAEWEYAASGPTHRKYPWGDKPEPTCANDTAMFSELGTTAGDGCGTGGTMPVGSKTAGASWCGALDMAGNVWEWVEDWWHSNYTGAPTDGSAWVSPTGSYRVIQGGGFMNDASYLRSSYRGHGAPSSRGAYAGGRCLRHLPVVCGGVTCPSVEGSEVTCNAQQACEYTRGPGSAMAYVPAGPFWMGANKDGTQCPTNALDTGAETSELPCHQVTVPGFLIDKYETTVAAYQACNTAAPEACTEPSTGAYCNWGGERKGTAPGELRQLEPVKGFLRVGREEVVQRIGMGEGSAGNGRSEVPMGESRSDLRRRGLRRLRLQRDMRGWFEAGRGKSVRCDGYERERLGVG